MRRTLRLKLTARTALASWILMGAVFASASALRADSVAPPADEITLERIMADPDWIGNSPEDAYWSDDGRSVYFSRKATGTDRRELFRQGKGDGAKAERVAGAERGRADQPHGSWSPDFRLKTFLHEGDVFVKDDDPVCATVAANIRSLCSLDALYMAVPAGTAGATNKLFNDGVTRPAVVVLQHPAPGKKGSLGNNTVIGPGTFRFDANLGKTFQISESKSLQVRFDAQNVLNHPQPSSGNSVIPALSITGTDAFGPHLPASIDHVEGLFYPSLAGESLSSLAEEIASR